MMFIQLGSSCFRWEGKKTHGMAWVGCIEFEFEFVADVDEWVIGWNLCCGDEDIVGDHRRTSKGEGGLTLHAINGCGEGGDIVHKTDEKVFAQNNTI